MSDTNKSQAREELKDYFKFAKELKLEEQYLKELEELEKLRKSVQSYRIQCVAAMRAGTLGLCKSVIKHAMEDDQKIWR